MLSVDAGMTHDAVVIELFIVKVLRVKQNEQLWVAKVILQLLNSFILPLFIWHTISEVIYVQRHGVNFIRTPDRNDLICVDTVK
jgi:hypothetical protein